MTPAAPGSPPVKSTTPPPANAAPTETGQLGVFDAMSIIVAIVIGTSLFKIPWLIFTSSDGPYAALLVWCLGGVLAFVGALCYAELATTFPRSGGDYVYLTKAFGPLTGFLFGWAQLTVILTASIASMAYVFGEFATGVYRLPHLGGEQPEGEVAQFIGGLTSEVQYAALAIIVVSLFNIIGVVLGKLAINLLTILKLAGLASLVVAGFAFAKEWPTNWPPAIIADETSTTFKLGWQSLAAILVLYAYGGWNDAAFVAAEVRDPRRNIPRALFLGVGLIMGIYLLVNTAYIVGLGWETASKPGLLPALLMTEALGENGGKAISVIVMISALGAVNGLIFTGSRVYATLGNDYRLFSFLGHWKPGRGAPVLALVAQAVITLLMLATFATRPGQQLVDRALAFVHIHPEGAWTVEAAFEILVSISAPIFWVFFLMTGFSLFVLREKTTAAQRPFSVPLYPLTPFIFCCMCVYMLYQSVMYVKFRVLFTVGLVAIGIPLYFLSRKVGYHDAGEEGM